MSDEKQPELSPAEQQKQDKAGVQIQLGQTDIARLVDQGLFNPGGAGSPGPGRTSFENHQLNAMIDLIEKSKPEDLEEAGKALWKARDAIKDAAKELKDFIADVDWHGESGIAFRDWGRGLVAHAEKLSDFADVAGTQITVAGTGLASVRSSLPPRDNRAVRKSPDEIETPKRIEGNAEYEAALKVEKDRQEAINQANRLASYYAVSEERLAAQEPPRFDKTLDVDMPRPSEGKRGLEEPGAASPTGSGSSGRADAGGVTAHTTTGGRGSSASDHGYETPVAVAPVLDRGTSTEINSVATPTAPVNTPPVTPSPAPTTSPAPGGPVPPMATGFVSPVTGSSRGPQAATNAPRAVGQAGGVRTSGPMSGGPAANGRTGSPVGRPAPVSGGSSSGVSGRAGGGPQPPAAGQSGATGGRPMAAGHAGTSGGAGPRAGRASGIVGGTPQRPVPGAGATGGARGVPRGTVIGAGGAARAGGPTDGVGQRGVVGTGGSAPRPGGRGMPSTNGVVGTPRGGAARPGAGAKGFTAGGSGLVRGPAGRRDSGDEDQDDGTPRPDYLTEDRETWEAGRRGTAPPVIE